MKRPSLWVGIAAVVLVLVGLTLLGGSGSAPPAGGPLAAATIPSLAPVGSPSAWPPGSPSPSIGSPAAAERPLPGAEEPLSVLLAMLQVAPEVRAGYSRSLFVHWIDADGNGCDTRQEVLIQEAIVKPGVGPKCSLSGGRWLSAYDGLTFSDPSKLQIDHVVPLAEAWDSGASAWTPDRRMRYANDLGAPFALIAVSAAANESKSDADPTDWLPPSRADECPYVGAWIATKVRWDLTIDQREHDALVTDVAGCASTTMPYLPAGPAGEIGGQPPSSAPNASGLPGSSCDPAYPTVCIPPPPPDLDCADIPYRDFTVLPRDPHHFDGDHDGIGCET